MRAVEPVAAAPSDAATTSPPAHEAGYREPHWGLMAAFLVFVVARYMQWGARRDIFEALRIEFTLGLALTVACSGLLAVRPVSMRRARFVLIAIGLLLVAIVVQIPFAAAPGLAKNVFVERVIKFAFLTFFMAVLIQSPRCMRWFVLAYLFSCFYITQESVRGLISGGLVWENQGVMRLHGAVPIYQHPNSLSGLAMGAIPFVVFLLPVWRRWYARLALLALLGTSLTCVIYTGSRTGYVALLAFLFFWWLHARRKGRMIAWGLVAAVITVLVVPQQYKERFLSIGGEEAEGASKATRIEILKDAWQIFLDNPGGIGVASFPAVRMQKFGRDQDTHNLYLEVATNLGVQGLAVFTVLIAVMLSAFARVRRELLRQLAALGPWLRWRRELPPPLRRRLRRHEHDLRFLTALSLAASGFVFVRLCLGFFGMDLYEVYWWFGAGLAISLLNLTERTAAVGNRLLAVCHAAAGSAAGGAA